MIIRKISKPTYLNHIYRFYTTTNNGTISLVSDVNNNNNNENNNSNNNDEDIEKSKSNILFDGTKAFIKNKLDPDLYKKPTNFKNLTYEGVIYQNSSNTVKEKEKRLEIIKDRIQNNPTQEKVYKKFYSEVINKEQDEEFRIEIAKRSTNQIYDEVTLEPPTNPQVYLEELLKDLRINQQFLFTEEEQVKLDKVHRDCLFEKDKIQEINKQFKGRFEKARDLYLMGDLDECIKKFEECENHGMSNIFLGNIYFNDLKYQNYSKAIEHFKLAARSNISVAYGMIGEMYLKGISVEANEEIARIYFIVAANLGLKSSTEQLIYMLINGVGGPIDTEKAIFYSKKLSEKGNLGAIVNLGGLLYDSDLEFTKSLWLYASRMGDANAQFLLGRHYYTRDNPDYNSSFLLWTESAKNSHPESQFYLGIMYDMGFIAKRSPEIALELFEQSAKQGNTSAAFLYGKALLNGDNIEQNEQMGWYWIEKAAEGGDQIAIDFINDQQTNYQEDSEDK
ncbi:tetratricopeptide-like helical domain-containing protein (TPR) [Tieghemostelium lacteum]|uniref:Tetratricopeptide-like helical domain-containing protein (TPR) n=1 Tax=Tieghemostelium lacteum TaxID=361077 RepID=A0A152A6P2_TIELA|nr:tetratricopeptide-like helical domain-containing protein (TPR) [Tieghemostelium lacteum]|eukprot:KYR01902.1 tetratricopeptide-like helical domain-containing protein (TPR) [Tieghemostelium lacteum]